MNILIVGNVLKDVYLNLDTRTEKFETDKHDTSWLDLSFDASEHHFFNRDSSLGGAAVSLEVLSKLGLTATITGSSLQLTEDGLSKNDDNVTHRYILIADNGISYLAPTNYQTTTFATPSDAYDYLYVDRSAELDGPAANKIAAYLDISPNTKLILYARHFDNPHLNSLLPRANLIFCENHRGNTEPSQAPALKNLPPEKLIYLSESQLSYQNISEPISINRIDMFTHLSIYSIAAATILGGFILGYSVEGSLRLARANLENSKLNSVLPLDELQSIADNFTPSNNLELIAQNLVLYPKGILAADESGGSIHKKFEQLNIPDTYDNRRDYRNIFFTTPGLADYVNGIILFNETAHQYADNGQNFVDFLTAQRIIPGIKVDQGLEKFDNSEETYTKGLDGLDGRLAEYYQMGLRFAKWRAAFELRLDDNGNILTPTDTAIEKNCEILAEYAKKCQNANIVPIIEPELVYDGHYTIDQCAETTSKILDQLFTELAKAEVNLKACILKVNMVLAGKKYEQQSTPDEVGQATAEVLKNHVPAGLAGVVFLSGGQTVEQATDNLAAVVKNGPFPWPVTFSFARALQDPALYAWQGDNANSDTARQAFKERLIANTKALKNNP